MDIGKSVLIVASAALALAMQPAAFAAQTKIQTTILNTADPESDLPAKTWTTIDTETVDCTNAKGCTLVISVVDQITGRGGKGKWGLAVAIDGSIVRGDTVFSQGYVPGNHVSAVGTWQNFWVVAPGSHTVAAESYVGTAAFQRRWSVSIGVGD